MTDDKKYIVVNSILIASVLIFFYLIANNSYHWYDDFYDIKTINAKGIFKDAIDVYMEWDGRGISPLSMLRGFIMINVGPELSAMLAVTVLLACGWIGYLIFSNQFYNKPILPLFYALVFGILMWMTFRAHLSRSVFWATGSFYIYSNLTLLLGIYLINKQSIKLWILIITTIVIGLSGINSAIGFFVYAFLLGILQFQHQREAISKFVIVLSVLLVCMAISTFAPGNFGRIGAGGAKLDFHLLNLPVNFFIIFKEYLLMSKWAVFGSILFVLVVERTPTSLSKNVMIKAVVYLIAALATILPFIPLPDAASKHTAIFFQSFLFLSLVTVGQYFFYYIPRHLIQRLKWILPFVLLYVLVDTYEQYKIGKVVKPSVIQRHEYLESIRNSSDTVYVDRIDQPSHFYTNRFFEISEDPDEPNNRGLQGIFNTGPIILKSVEN